MSEDKFTNEELFKLEKIADNLIVWMFNRPHDMEPIRASLKDAFRLGKESKDNG